MVRELYRYSKVNVAFVLLVTRLRWSI